MEFSWRQKIALIIVGVSCLALGTISSSGAETVGSRLSLAQAEQPRGEGTLNAIDVSGRKLNITHGPVAALNWPGMTMDFAVSPGVDLSALKMGSKIKFTLVRGANGMFAIDEVKPAD